MRNVWSAPVAYSINMEMLPESLPHRLHAALLLRWQHAKSTNPVLRPCAYCGILTASEPYEGLNDERLISYPPCCARDACLDRFEIRTVATLSAFGSHALS